MEKKIIEIVALVIFLSPFIVFPFLLIAKLRKDRKAAPPGQAQVPVPSVKEQAAHERNQHASHLQEVYPALNQAAGDFLRLLSDKDFKGDLTLAAEMAGLKMLRGSGADLARHTPGHILLGALPDEAYKRMERFLYSWYLSNGIPVEGVRDVQIPKEDMEYLPQVVRLEAGFDAICREHGVTNEDAPYAAALAAAKLVAAGRKLQLVETHVAQYTTIYHIISASKMVPQLIGDL
jgi:hypothetical protein